MLSKAAETILERRYLLRNEKGGVIETVPELFRRVANAIAAPEGALAPEYSDKFYNLMTSMDFLPNTPTLMNAGTPDGQLSACFVLPIDDSMDSIFSTLRDAALIHKTGGGTGFPFSNLRPTNSAVKSTGGVASGPISFMKVYNAATEAVKQGGKRRGANMGMLRVDHPNIMDFINCKRDTSQLTNFNTSIAVTDVFMDAVKSDSAYDLIEPHSKEVVGTLQARQVWNEIVKAVWETGEPGVFFVDRANAFNPTPGLGDFETTNPCGEQPLLPYESCNLGSINLLNMYVGGYIDYEKLDATVCLAVRFLDNVIEVNHYPLPEIDRVSKLTRKIGLGVMGWADLLLKLGIAYGSDESLQLAEYVAQCIRTSARRYSRKLGKERGSFPAKKESIWKDEPYMRNAAITTIAPTGTISMIADVSSGIEPIFGFAYVKNVMDNDKFVYVNATLKEHLVKLNLYSKTIVDELTKTGRVTDIDRIPASVKDIFVCAYDISAENHIKMQAAFQHHTDNAISKTINYPSNATMEQIEAGYALAYKLGCKGVTAYRDGSRDSQVLTIGTLVPTGKVVPRDRTQTTQGFTDKLATGCGNLYITVNYDEQGICEVFTNTGKAGGCPSQSEASARLATLALRANIDHESIINQLIGIRCPAAVRNKKSQCLSCPDAIAKTLKKAIKQLDSNTVIDQPTKITEEVIEVAEGGKSCPECGTPMNFSEGCVMCQACGYSKCN